MNKKICALMLVSMLLLVTAQSISAEVTKSDNTSHIDKESPADEPITVFFSADMLLFEVILDGVSYKPGEVAYIEEEGEYSLVAKIKNDDRKFDHWVGTTLWIDIKDPTAQSTTVDLSWPGGGIIIYTEGKSRAASNPFLRFLQNHPNMFPLLQRLLGL